MDDAKRNEIEEKVKNCKLKIANEQAKLKKYETQLEVGKAAHTKNRSKTVQKPIKSTPNPGQKQNEPKKEMGIFETIFS